ncbi:MAG: hypothetical protein MK102_00295 [Fuerstiella sp.]|nr:hypothetical protein [Fuerstiella sp.]
MNSLGLYCFAAAFAGIVLIAQEYADAIVERRTLELPNNLKSANVYGDDVFDREGTFYDYPADDGFRDVTRSVERTDHNQNRPKFLRG